MGNAKTIIYDGSFNGFLTLIFKAFKENWAVADIQKNKGMQRGFFTETETVFTQMEEAKRVWNGIEGKNSTAIRTIYFAFLSEIQGVELLLYRYICSLYNKPLTGPWETIETDLSKIHQYKGMVAREKHRIEASAEFNISQDEVYFSTIAPLYDVLPLVSRHYRLKFPNKEFILYDLKRKYAIHYNGHQIDLISLSLALEQFGGSLSHTAIKPLINDKLFQANTSESSFSFMGEKTAV